MEYLGALKRFVFDGLLLDQELLNLEKRGISVRGQDPGEIVDRIQEVEFSPVVLHKATQMASVFGLFFCLENSVRELINERLSERYGAGWWEQKVPEKIKRNVEQLKQKETKNKYHAQRSVTPIGYTTFGNLSQIIIENWEDFSDLIPDQHWVKARFNDLEMSRNIIMHTNVLPDAEIERLENTVKDWLKQVG